MSLVAYSQSTKVFKFGSRKPLHNWFTAKNFMKQSNLNCYKYFLSGQLVPTQAEYRFSPASCFFCCNHTIYYLLELVSRANMSSKKNIIKSNALLILCKLQLLFLSPVLCRVWRGKKKWSFEIKTPLRRTIFILWVPDHTWSIIEMARVLLVSLLSF